MYELRTTNTAAADSRFKKTEGGVERVEFGADGGIQRAMIGEPLLQFRIVLAEVQRLGKGGVSCIRRAGAVQLQDLFCLFVSHFLIRDGFPGRHG